MSNINFLRQLPEEILVVEYENKRKAERINRKPAYLYSGIMFFHLDSISQCINDVIEDYEKDEEDAQAIDLGTVILGRFTGYDFGEEYGCFGSFTSRSGEQFVIQRGEEVGRYEE